MFIAVSGHTFVGMASALSPLVLASGLQAEGLPNQLNQASGFARKTRPDVTLHQLAAPTEMLIPEPVASEAGPDGRIEVLAAGLSLCCSGCETGMTLVLPVLTGAVLFGLATLVIKWRSRVRQEREAMTFRIARAPSQMRKLDDYSDKYRKQVTDAILRAERKDLVAWPVVMEQIRDGNYGNAIETLATRLKPQLKAAERERLLPFGLALAAAYKGGKEGASLPFGTFNLLKDFFNEREGVAEEQARQNAIDRFWLDLLQYFVFGIHMEGIAAARVGEIKTMRSKGRIPSNEKMHRAFQRWLDALEPEPDPKVRLRDLPLYRDFAQALKRHLNGRA